MKTTTRRWRIFAVALLAIPIGFGLPKAYAWVQENVRLGEARESAGHTDEHAEGAHGEHAHSEHAAHKVVATHPTIKP